MCCMTWRALRPEPHLELGNDHIVRQSLLVVGPGADYACHVIFWHVTQETIVCTVANDGQAGLVDDVAGKPC